MKLYKAAIAILLSTAFSLSIFAHDPKGESFQLSGKLTSVELTDEGKIRKLRDKIRKNGITFEGK